MSPRAAWRLDRLGFGRVYDYGAGKADWLAFALPYEGEARLVADRLTTDVDTCSVDDSLGAVRHPLQASRFGMLIVLTASGMVAGTLALTAADGPDDAAVEDVMREGPTTVRPSEDVDALSHRMSEAGVDGVLVTSSDGQLLGVFQQQTSAGDAAGHR